MDRRVLAFLFLFLFAGCGAEAVAREPAPSPEPAFAFASTVEDEAESPRRHVREPYVDCRKVAEVGYRRGKKFSIVVVGIDGTSVEQRTADAYWAMREAAANDGVELVIYSGFRTQAEQEYFYHCYRECACNGCSPAAKPGHSNHQSGSALDLAMAPGAHDWLVANASRFGFRSPVKREPWHWEYRPAKRSRGFPALCPDA
jgi:hypothetical protein